MGSKIVDLNLVEKKCDELRLREQALWDARGTADEPKLRDELHGCIKELNVILEGLDPVEEIQRLIDKSFGGAQDDNIGNGEFFK